MNTEKKKYKIDIFDEEYVLISDEAEPLINNAALFVDKTTGEIGRAHV